MTARASLALVTRPNSTHAIYTRSSYCCCQIMYCHIPTDIHKAIELKRFIAQVKKVCESMKDSAKMLSYCAAFYTGATGSWF